MNKDWEVRIEWGYRGPGKVTLSAACVVDWLTPMFYARVPELIPGSDLDFIFLLIQTMRDNIVDSSDLVSVTCMVDLD